VSRAFPFRIIPLPDTVLGRWLAAREAHPESFVCGVRVRSGAVAGEGPAWQFRRSAADPLITDGVVALNHGPKQVLQLRPAADPFGPQPQHPARPGHLIFAAVEQRSQAEVEVSVDVRELARFGLDAP
jgi:hypothetical protein